MKKVQEGLFLVEEKMPCSPRDIVVPHYALLGTIGRFEEEEAAARVLSLSQELDRWVGVSWPRFAEMMRKDLEDERYLYESRQQFSKHPNTANKYFILCVLTLGIYALFAPKPQPRAEAVEEPEEKELPFSLIFIHGPQSVVNGIHALLEKGMLRRVREGEGENLVDVVFPTPTLISHIMQKQGVEHATKD